MIETKYIKYGEKVAGNATIITVLLTISKAFIGFLSGSLVLLTDALHSGVDVLTTFASFLGLKVAGKKPTERFKYGYYKAESLASLFISLLILLVAFNFLIEGYHKLFIISKINFTTIALAIALISSITSFFLSKYLKTGGEKINSQALIINAKDRKIDVFSSLAVFIAILASFYKAPYVEGVVVIGLALLILRIGILSVKDSIFALMDISPSITIENKIKKILKSTNGAESFEQLKLRKSGPFIFGEVTIKIKKFIDVARAHEVTDNIENEIRNHLKEISALTIHVEPYRKKELKIVIPIKEDRGLNSKIMEHFGRTKYFMFLNIKGKRIKSFYVKSNPYKTKEVRAGMAAIHNLTKEKIDILITKEIGEISFHTLRDNFVEVYQSEGKTVKEISEKFIKNKLQILKESTKQKN